MGKGKIQVWLVRSNADGGLGETQRLIRGTLREVEALLRQEVDITPCSAERAHELHDITIEEAA